MNDKKEPGNFVWRKDYGGVTLAAYVDLSQVTGGAPRYVVFAGSAGWSTEVFSGSFRDGRNGEKGWSFHHKSPLLALLDTGGKFARTVVDELRQALSSATEGKRQLTLDSLLQHPTPKE